MLHSTSFQSGFIALVGRPNSGKSTLMNTVLGEDLSVVTPLPQTTRKNLRGILTTSSMQLVFIDTPGIHTGKYVLNRAMINETQGALKDKGIDCVGYIVDISRDFGDEEKTVAEIVIQSGIPALVIFNKMDLCKNCDSVTGQFLKLFPLLKTAPQIRITAASPDARAVFLDAVLKFIPEGPKYYENEELTDANLRFFAAEYLRKHIILNTRDEVPHAVYVEIESYEETPGKHRIDTVIHVETIGQRGIIIGKGGALIAKIRKGAEKDMKALAGAAVTISCHIKVTPQWRDNEGFLRTIGYRPGM
jgi:GTPase